MIQLLVTKADSPPPPPQYPNLLFWEVRVANISPQAKMQINNSFLKPSISNISRNDMSTQMCIINSFSKCCSDFEASDLILNSIQFYH